MKMGHQDGTRVAGGLFEQGEAFGDIKLGHGQGKARKSPFSAGVSEPSVNINIANRS
jgi:hypothetical protein